MKQNKIIRLILAIAFSAFSLIAISDDEENSEEVVVFPEDEEAELQDLSETVSKGAIYNWKLKTGEIIYGGLSGIDTGGAAWCDKDYRKYKIKLGCWGKCGTGCGGLNCSTPRRAA